MKTKVRKATAGDAGVILGFIKELAQYAREPDAVEATEADIRKQMESGHSPFECLIAEVDGAPAGFALYFFNYSTWRGKAGLYIEDIFVSPQKRGCGAGSALFRELGTIAGEKGCGRIEFAVLDWNEPAKKFYSRFGARPLHEWTVYRISGHALDALAKAQGSRKDQG